MILQFSFFLFFFLWCEIVHFSTDLAGPGVQPEVDSARKVPSNFHHVLHYCLFKSADRFEFAWHQGIANPIHFLDFVFFRPVSDMHHFETTHF
jgi:hypothetical protein